VSIINAEQQAKVRQYRYTAATVIALAGPALAAALAAGGVSKWIAVAVAVGTALTGPAGTAYAAKNTKSQVNDGMFTPTPEPEPEPPLPLPDVVLGAMQQAAQNVATSVSELDAIKNGASQILGTVLGPQLGSVAQATLDSVKLPRL
jgi:hypothetical protein